MSVILHEPAIRGFFTNRNSPMGFFITELAGEAALLMEVNLRQHSRSGKTADACGFKGMGQDADALFALVGSDHQLDDGFSPALALEFGNESPGVWKEGVQEKPGKRYHYPWAAPALEQLGFRRIA